LSKKRPVGTARNASKRQTFVNDSVVDAKRRGWLAAERSGAPANWDFAKAYFSKPLSPTPLHPARVAA
jgi:hypothetical protein